MEGTGQAAWGKQHCRHIHFSSSIRSSACHSHTPHIIHHTSHIHTDIRLGFCVTRQRHRCRKFRAHKVLQRPVNTMQPFDSMISRSIRGTIIATTTTTHIQTHAHARTYTHIFIPDWLSIDLVFCDRGGVNRAVKNEGRKTCSTAIFFFIQTTSK